MTVSGVVPIERGDRNMAPTYPGITDSPTLDDWNPPFPVDLRRIRKVDEEYWEKYRTTPKAFVSLETGQPLWQTRYGSMTSIRVRPQAGQSLTAARDQYIQRLRAAADPLALGVAVIDVRQQGLEASRGATDFGEYFVYFSLFIVVSARIDSSRSTTPRICPSTRLRSNCHFFRACLRTSPLSHCSLTTLLRNRWRWSSRGYLANEPCSS